MADPISVASGLLTLAAFAFERSKSLSQTIESYESSPKTARELQQELGALNRVLSSLQGTAADGDADLAALNFPLLRCGKACEDFEKVFVKYRAHSGGSKNSFGDWAKLKYMGNDIVGFKNMLAGYKSTICIALAHRNLLTGAVTANVIVEFKEMITHTILDLEDRLQEIDRSLQTLSLEGTAVHNKEGDKREHNQETDSGLRYSSPQVTGSLGDYTIEQAGLQEEEEHSTRQCLAICAEAFVNVDDGQVNHFEDVSVARAHQIVIATLGDLISARRVTASVRSRQWLGQISDVTIRKFIKDHTGLTPKEEQQPYPHGENFRSAKMAFSQEYSEDIQSSISVDSNTEVESIFSAPESVNSSKASISPGEVMNTGADEIVAALLQSEEIRLLYEKAIESNGIGAERFERNLYRLLNHYSSDLKETASTPDEKAATALIQYHSQYMARNFGIKTEGQEIGDDQYLRLKRRDDTLDRKAIIEKYLR